MTKFHGTLVRPLADQADRDGTRIDPASIRISDDEIPIYAGLGYDVLGRGKLVRAEDGSIEVHGELFTRLSAGRLAVSGRVVHSRQEGDTRLIDEFDLISVSFVGKHSDESQPTVIFEED